MIDWLLKISGRNNSHNMEREELIELRKETAKIRKSLLKDEEAELQSESDTDDEDTEDADKFEKIIIERRSLLQNRTKRSSVSAEVYGIFNKQKEFKPKVIEKSDEQITRIKERMSNCFIFNCIDDKDLQTVIEAMEEAKFKSGERVINQGDNGDVLFLVESGELDCYKKFNDSDTETYLKSYYPGESFGELALLYNTSRAASIVAKSDCILWALDRETFNHIVKEASINKRERYQHFLKSVNILKSIEAYEISLISDALKSEKVKSGEYIIKRGEEGDKFYILEEGKAYATKKLNDDGKYYYKLIYLDDDEKNVLNYSPGDYFGELALIKNESRAANVIAETDCKLLSLDRRSFKRLLGPIENIMQRLSAHYIKYITK